VVRNVYPYLPLATNAPRTIWGGGNFIKSLTNFNEFFPSHNTPKSVSAYSAPQTPNWFQRGRFAAGGEWRGWEGRTRGRRKMGREEKGKMRRGAEKGIQRTSGTGSTHPSTAYQLFWTSWGQPFCAKGHSPDPRKYSFFFQFSLLLGCWSDDSLKTPSRVVYVKF